MAQITTFGTMKAKAVVRDVGRALGMSFAETDRIAKLIPEDLKMTIDKALDMEPELMAMSLGRPQTPSGQAHRRLAPAGGPVAPRLHPRRRQWSSRTGP